MNEILIAMSRKMIFVLLLWISYKLFDKFELKGFDTCELLKQDSKAVALLLGLLSIAIALC